MAFPRQGRASWPDLPPSWAPFFPELRGPVGIKGTHFRCFGMRAIPSPAKCLVRGQTGSGGPQLMPLGPLPHPGPLRRMPG